MIGIAESHLRENTLLEVDDYNWHGNDRNDTYRPSSKGSGGVGLFVRKSLYTEFNISNIRSDTEGILWIELHHKTTKELLRFCVCYLPPNNSSRNINSEEYLHPNV